MLAVIANISALLVAGDESLVHPEDALRQASASIAVLEYAKPSSVDDVELIRDLQVMGLQESAERPVYQKQPIS